MGGRLNLEPAFRRYIGIDYSGAEAADSSCRGLRVYAAEGIGTPEQVYLDTRLVPCPELQS